MGVSVLGKHAVQGGLSDGSGAVGIEVLQMFCDLFSIGGHEAFSIRLEEEFDAFPLIRDQASPSSGRLKDTGGGRKPEANHSVAQHIENGAGSDVEGVVVAGIEVAERSNIRKLRTVLIPAAPGEEERFLREKSGRAVEKFEDACLWIGKPVAEKTESCRKRGIRCGGVVRFWIERVINGNALDSTETLVGMKIVSPLSGLFQGYPVAQKLNRWNKPIAKSVPSSGKVSLFGNYALRKEIHGTFRKNARRTSDLPTVCVSSVPDIRRSEVLTFRQHYAAQISRQILEEIKSDGPSRP